MPGNATLWDVLPDGRLVIAHTDDRAVMIARRPEDVERSRSVVARCARWPRSLSHDGRLLLFSESARAAARPAACIFAEWMARRRFVWATAAPVALSPDTRWAIAFSQALPSPYLEIVPTGAGERRRLAGNGLGYTGAQLAS